MLNNLNGHLYLPMEEDEDLEKRLSCELEERIELACYSNTCGCKGEFVVPAA